MGVLFRSVQSPRRQKVGDADAVGTGGQQSPTEEPLTMRDRPYYTEDKELLAEAAPGTTEWLEETTRSKDPRVRHKHPDGGDVPMPLTMCRSMFSSGA